MIEDEALSRLGLLKQVNQQLEQVYKHHAESVANLQTMLASKEQEHHAIIEGDTDMRVAEARLIELEQALSQLKVQVEEVAQKNETIKLQRGVGHRFVREVDERVVAE